MTFDELLSGHKANLVKIDVEGAEFQVLEGMKNP
jgi:FkbM family methyltransferase